eukprot:RCo024261
MFVAGGGGSGQGSARKLRDDVPRFWGNWLGKGPKVRSQARGIMPRSERQSDNWSVDVVGTLPNLKNGPRRRRSPTLGASAAVNKDEGVHRRLGHRHSFDLAARAVDGVQAAGGQLAHQLLLSGDTVLHEKYHRRRHRVLGLLPSVLIFGFGLTLFTSLGVGAHPKALPKLPNVDRGRQHTVRPEVHGAGHLADVVGDHHKDLAKTLLLPASDGGDAVVVRGRHKHEVRREPGEGRPAARLRVWERPAVDVRPGVLHQGKGGLAPKRVPVQHEHNFSRDQAHAAKALGWKGTQEVFTAIPCRGYVDHLPTHQTQKVSCGADQQPTRTFRGRCRWNDGGVAGGDIADSKLQAVTAVVPLQRNQNSPRARRVSGCTHEQVAQGTLEECPRKLHRRRHAEVDVQQQLDHIAGEKPLKTTQDGGQQTPEIHRLHHYSWPLPNAEP